MDGGGNVTESFIDTVQGSASKCKYGLGSCSAAIKSLVAHCIGMAVFDHHVGPRTTWLSAMLEHYIAIVVVVQHSAPRMFRNSFAAGGQMVEIIGPR